MTPAIVLLADTDAGETSEASLRVFNRGTETLQLRGVQTSAASLTVDGFEAQTVPTGEDARALLAFAPAGGAAFASWLDIISDDPDQPRQCVAVRANQAGASIGDEVGDLSFLTRQAATLRLSDLRDGPVLLAYFATF